MSDQGKDMALYANAPMINDTKERPIPITAGTLDILLIRINSFARNLNRLAMKIVGGQS